MSEEDKILEEVCNKQEQQIIQLSQENIDLKDKIEKLEKELEQYRK